MRAKENETDGLDSSFERNEVGPSTSRYQSTSRSHWSVRISRQNSPSGAGQQDPAGRGELVARVPAATPYPAAIFLAMRSMWPVAPSSW